MKNFNVSGVWSFLGVALFLVLVYLVLQNSAGAKAVGGTLFNGTANLFTVLQGRTPKQGVAA